MMDCRQYYEQLRERFTGSSCEGSASGAWIIMQKGLAQWMCQPPAVVVTCPSESDVMPSEMDTRIIPIMLDMVMAHLPAMA